MLVDNIKQLCNQHGISIPELEQSVGLGNGLIYRWKTSSPNLSSIQKVANYFGVTVSYLLHDNPTQNNTKN